MAGKAKGLAASLARRTLAAAQSGQGVPRDVQDAARRVYGGVSGEGDLALLTKFWGVRRTGASAIKGAVRGLRMFGSSVENISREASILSARADQGSPVDRARFVQAVLGEVEKYSKTKLVKELAKDFATNMGRDGIAATRFLTLFRGALRLGGAVATVGALGLEWWESSTHRNDAVNAARGRNIDAYRTSFVGVDRKQAIADAARKRFVANRLFGGALDFLGTGSADLNDRLTQEYVEKQTEEELKLITAKRENARLLGVDPGKILAQEAAKRGISVENLTPREKAQIIDDATDARLNARQYLYDEQTQRQLDKEFGTVLLPKTERQREQRRYEIARERQQAEIEKKKEALAAAHEVAMKLRESRTAGERLALSRQQDQARASFASYASRHKTFNWG